MTTNKFNIGEVLEVVEGTEDMNFTWYPEGTLVTVIGRSEYMREDSDSESSYIVSKGEGTQQYLRPSQLKRVKKTPKWFVTIEETFTYNLEIEADTKQQAEDLAFNNAKFTMDEWDDNDAHITQIDEAPTEEVIEHTYYMQATANHTFVYESGTNKQIAKFESLDDAVAFIKMKEGR